MASPLRTLFLTEAVLKVMGGSIFFFAPSTILKNLSEPPYPVTSLSLIQALGTQTLAFSIPLFLAARIDSTSIKSRRIVYYTLLGREALLAFGLLAQIGWSYLRGWRGGRRDSIRSVEELEEGLVSDRRGTKEDEKKALEMLRRGLWLWVAEVAPFVVGRMWILGFRKEWFK
ncbi:uncharacterized protein BDR25DRAFT_310557 [Lindgomyces ingoldianus]|uniref:Uncharacterized protein n=1 Tax=Lindgomyces ingoldianus TaxID=673940 RepID=A0ACB6R9U4_9PLEO|nr:uncharacterized protein BDR25DRAFT_310557 [Lindgomyces ingoldianus]KAF2475102.1 hypothetical protein BDR25DRAFT_310557 [Lindgomyces ingoldianus]